MTIWKPKRITSSKHHPQSQFLIFISSQRYFALYLVYISITFWTLLRLLAGLFTVSEHLNLTTPANYVFKGPFGNLGIGISASASASSIYSVKHVISNKVITYRLEACDFARKCFTKICRRKSPYNLRRVTMKNPCSKTSVLESVFNEIAGINSRLASLMKKSLDQKYLLLNILELSALLQEDVT